MKLDRGIISTLFRTELRMVLRDRRMVLTSILLPLLLTPLLMLVSTSTVKKRERTLQQMTYPYAVTGPEAEAVQLLLARARTKSEFHLNEVTNAAPLAALDKGEIQLVLEGFRAKQNSIAATNHEALSETTGNTNSIVDEGEATPPGSLVVRLIYRADRDVSQAAMSRMRDALDRSREADRAALLKEHGFAVLPAQVAVISERDLASRAQRAGLMVGRLLPVSLLFLILVAGAVIAMDSLAGEKERGTLETLLTTGATRAEVLVAKHLVIEAVALFITLLQLGNLLVYCSFHLLRLPADLAAAVPLPVALLLLVLFLPVVALAGNVLLLISGYARSYKEAQMYFMPVLLLGLVPALATFMPGVGLRSIVVLVPIANLAVAIKEVLIGQFDWPFLALAWVITAGAAVWTTRLGVRLLSTERLITAAQTDAVSFTGGQGLFERHLVGWFALMWAALLVASNYLEKTDLRLQLAINLVVILFGGCSLMIRRYRLNLRAALALRAPHPAIWLGVLVAVPGGLLTATALFELSNRVLPVSDKTLEAFNQTLLPTQIPFAQLIFCLTVLPGIFEEIAFRGLLLYGLHRRLSPVPLALVVGLVFGLFHIALFRFVPTACLGAMLASVTLLTGSIFPAMLWHAANNGLGVLIYELHLPEANLGWPVYLIGLALLGVAYWIFWRHRSPYPGLKSVRVKESSEPA